MRWRSKARNACDFTRFTVDLSIETLANADDNWICKHEQKHSTKNAQFDNQCSPTLNAYEYSVDALSKTTQDILPSAHYVTDGIGRICRNGLNFTERGFGIRGAVGCSDRANTAISQATPEDFDFDYIFGKLGVRWLHTGGIYAALSEQACDTVRAACKTAKKYGTLISYDLNYRPSMWSAIGGQAKAQEVNRDVAQYVDVMIGNEEDFTACLGFQIEGNDANLKELNIEGYKKMISEAAKTYPNFKAVATTLRTVPSATVNDWKALCWAGGEIFMSKAYDGLEIMDRVGGGDSFASGLVYGLMTTGDPEKAVNYGAAHGALAMTTPGDTSMANVSEVEAIMGGAGARVKR